MAAYYVSPRDEGYYTIPGSRLVLAPPTNLPQYLRHGPLKIQLLAHVSALTQHF